VLFVALIATGAALLYFPMDAYSFSLTLGAAGLGIMALSGFAHAHGGHHVSSHAGGHHAGHHLASLRGHAGGAARHAGGVRGGAPRALWALLSPRPMFGMLVGFGAAGVALRGVLHGGALLGVAAVGALALEYGVMSPLWNFLFRFESAPALTLESCLGDEVRAATNFDADGHGLIAVELDGQIVQVLGSLRREDRDAGVRVRAGDPVRIDDIDPARNRCTVRPIGA
jgi:hypothetical protein